MTHTRTYEALYHNVVVGLRIAWEYTAENLYVLLLIILCLKKENKLRV